MIAIYAAEWSKPSDRQGLKYLRNRVFLDEQGISCSEEIDGFDASRRHLVTTGDGIGWIGCASVISSGQLGRMTVQKAIGIQGIGASLLNHAI